MREFTDEQKLVFGRFYYLREKAGNPVPEMFKECYEFYVEKEIKKQEDGETMEGK